MFIRKAKIYEYIGCDLIGVSGIMILLLLGYTFTYNDDYMLDTFLTTILVNESPVRFNGLYSDVFYLRFVLYMLIEHRPLRNKKIIK